MATLIDEITAELPQGDDIVGESWETVITIPEWYYDGTTTVTFTE